MTTGSLQCATCSLSGTLVRLQFCTKSQIFVDTSFWRTHGFEIRPPLTSGPTYIPIFNLAHEYSRWILKSRESGQIIMPRPPRFERLWINANSKLKICAREVRVGQNGVKGFAPMDPAECSMREVSVCEISEIYFHSLDRSHRKITFLESRKRKIYVFGGDSYPPGTEQICCEEATILYPGNAEVGVPQLRVTQVNIRDKRLLESCTIPKSLRCQLYATKVKLTCASRINDASTGTVEVQSRYCLFVREYELECIFHNSWVFKPLSIQNPIRLPEVLLSSEFRAVICHPKSHDVKEGTCSKSNQCDQQPDRFYNVHPLHECTVRKLLHQSDARGFLAARSDAAKVHSTLWIIGHSYHRSDAQSSATMANCAVPLKEAAA